MSLDTFLSSVRLTDLARSNRFIFTILLPPRLIGNNYSLEIMSLYASEVSGALSWNVATKGQSQSTIAYSTPYSAFNDESSVVVTFLMDGNMHIRHLFDNWAEITYDPEKGQVEYYDNLRTRARLELLNQSDIPIYAWEFYDVLMDQITPLNLSNANEKFMELPITFKYRYWKAVEPTQVPPVARQEENALMEIYRIAKPYLAARFPQIGKAEQTVSNINLGLRTLSSIFGS